MKRLVQPGAVRVPSARTLINGKALAGTISAEIRSNAHYQADGFTVEFALNAPGGRDLDWWGADERKGELFDVRLSLDGDERSFILGEADRIDVHPVTGLVRVEGRDLTARFIEHRSQEAFQNKTASEVATILATRRGLTPVVTATTTPVSRFYGADHDRVQHDQFSSVGTEWDLLTRLAQAEGFDCFVTGRELHFQPAVDPAKTEPFAVKWDQDERKSDILKIDLSRSLTLAKDVVVIVRSWASAKGRGFSRSSPAGQTKAKVNAGTAQRYVFTRPNLTEDAAQKEADRLREEITKHERTLSFDVPGELELSPRSMLLVSGVGGWDQRYFVNTITRRISFDGGFVQSVTAKNKNVESNAATGGGPPLTEGLA